MTREEAKREILFAKREVMADSWIDKAYDVAIQALEQPEQGWIPVTKEQILQAGYEGREVRFHIGGRLFAIRELAQ